jgi:hypothetical protein
MDAQQAIDSAISEATRLQKAIASGGRQVTSDDEKQLVKATAFAWFNNHRKVLSPLLGDDYLKGVDDSYRALLTATGKATLRSKYVQCLKEIKKGFVGLQSDHAVTLSTPVITVSPSPDIPPAFAPLISDPKMQGILVRRWQECVACVNSGAPLAATVMMGGLLEGLLLARINQLTDKGPVFRASAAPKDRAGTVLKLNEWGLKNYIDVAHELAWISKTTKDIGEVVRDYRNFIHPQKELSHGINLSGDDARMLWEIAKSLVGQILRP